MNSFNSVLSGLLSSLLLSLGFRQLAAGFDPLNQATAANTCVNGDQTLSAVGCTPCRLSAVGCTPCRLQGI